MNSRMTRKTIVKLARRNPLLLTGLFVLGSLICVCGPLLAQTRQIAHSPIQGKNVSVYLEDADFGFQTPGFSYEPQHRTIHLDEKTPSQSFEKVRPAGYDLKPEENPKPIPRKTLRYSAAKLQHPSLTAKPLQGRAKPLESSLFVPIPVKKQEKNITPKYDEDFSFNTIHQIKLIDGRGTRRDKARSDSSTPLVNPWEGVFFKTASNEKPNDIRESAVRTVSMIVPAEPSFPPELPALPEMHENHGAFVQNTPSETEGSFVSNPMQAAPALPPMIAVSRETPPAPPVPPEMPKPMELPRSPEFVSLAWKKGAFTFTPYGYVNLSCAWESQRTVAGDYCVYARSPDLSPESDRAAFHVDPRSSRIGLKIDGPGINAWCGSKTQGVFEIDFQGAYQVRNRSGFLLRKAYVEIGDERTKFLIGQDWEIVAPLYPMIFNYPAGSGVGNIGYRRAMVKMDHKIQTGTDSTILLQFGICDNTIRDYPNSGPEEPKVTTSGWPILQGRLASSFGKRTFAHGQDVSLGVSGQIGEQRADYPGGGPKGLSHQTWVVCFDFDVPLTKRLRLQAEYYDGENVSNLEGGVLQGIDLFRHDTIRCRGGWGAISYQWNRKTKTNFGYAVEDPLDRDTLATSSLDGGVYVSRTKNQCLFGNITYNWSEALMTGVELSFWKTDWRKYDSVANSFERLEAGKPVRVEFVTRYSF